MTLEDPLILYDGGCPFCSGAVAFIRRHDGSDRFRYVTLDSPEARRLLAADGSGCDTLHLFDAAGHHERSTAVLRIAASLDAPWSLFRILRVVPRALRDAVYDFVARHRQRRD